MDTCTCTRDLCFHLPTLPCSLRPWRPQFPHMPLWGGRPLPGTTLTTQGFPRASPGSVQGHGVLDLCSFPQQQWKRARLCWAEQSLVPSVTIVAGRLTLPVGLGDHHSCPRHMVSLGQPVWVAQRGFIQSACVCKSAPAPRRCPAHPHKQPKRLCLPGISRGAQSRSRATASSCRTQASA